MWSTSKRDSCKRLILLIINCAACIAVVYTYISSRNNDEKQNGISSEQFIRPETLIDEQCTQVCNSSACVWHANMLLRSIKENLDPCDDFHSFLCSSFTTRFGIDEKAAVITETRNLLLNKLKGILENIEAEPESASGKLKTVYDSCINYGSSELQAIEDFKSFLSDIGILNWPDLPEDFAFDGVQLPDILFNLRKFGSIKFLYLKHLPGNETRESSVLVTLYESSLNQSIKLSRELAVSMLKYFDLEANHMDAIIEDYELVKNSILKLSQEYERCFGEGCQYVKIDCAKQTDDDWNDFCGTLRTIHNINDPNNTNPVVIDKPFDIFFKELFSLFHSFPNRSLANFVALSLIKSFRPELNFYFRLSKLKQKDITDHEVIVESYEIDRRKYCVRWIADNMKLPLQNEYFRQHLTKSTTKELTNIYEDFSSEITDLVALQTWIPSEVKSILTEKFRNTTFNIGYMGQFLPNDSYANKIYEKFLPIRESFFRNVLKIKSFSTLIHLPFMDIIRHLPRDEAVLHITKFEVDASATPSHFPGNPYLIIHYGMVLPPYYVPGHLNIMNRVLLAGIIGHEFGHILFGTLEDELVNLTTILQKIQCIADQFSRFRFDYLNENLDGSKYYLENVPDNVATAVIDKVIEKYSSSEDITLPGLPYTAKQLFYMSSIQTWCAKSNEKRDLKYRDLEFHAPSEFRLLAMMQNSRGNPEAFHCPEGSYMNPVTKCAILETTGI